jgi:cell division protein FtsQ
MVSSQGQVFDAGGDREEGDLPTLVGPEGHAAELLAVYRLLAPLAGPLDAPISKVALLERGNWQVELGTGAVVELGQGAPADLASRFWQFAATAAQVAGRHQRSARDIESADLRHMGGYALRLRGVGTERQGAAPR